MLSAAASDGSPCLFDAQFTSLLEYPTNTFIIWRVGTSIYIKTSSKNFIMRQANNTYTLFIKCVHKYMNGKVLCELHERLPQNRSRLIEMRTGRLCTYNPAWFMNTGRAHNILYQYNPTRALLPYVFGDFNRVSTVQIRDNKLIILQVPEPSLERNNIDACLHCFIYKFEQKIVYVKLIYDKSLLKACQIQVNMTRGLTIAAKSTIEIRWNFDMTPETCFIFEISDQAGIFPNITPLPQSQVSKRPMVTIVTPPEHILIAVRIRTVRPLPGEPTPNHVKHVVLKNGEDHKTGKTYPSSSTTKASKAQCVDDTIHQCYSLRR